ncbi:hypothetical protein BWI93_06650 [Siphonobacter sp. BAB-5385]|uniref:type II toxin-antitoxin system VapB family antitoxin n=1 Tax=unclassified Siphonobacter TaxID=2635712 RepID=UPI000B9EC14D|nr:DUF2281 domain-containing protein [Siphonobacter sp. BAB-5385]OZI08906.1 hypothetical protein BWI93_06650 [Siphonobacter sp. BAB-5385]
MLSTTLLSEIRSLSPELQQEVEHFVQFLKTKMDRESTLNEREYGYAKGKVHLSNDFDDPLEAFEEYR